MKITSFLSSPYLREITFPDHSFLILLLVGLIIDSSRSLVNHVVIANDAIDNVTLREFEPISIDNFNKILKWQLNEAKINFYNQANKTCKIKFCGFATLSTVYNESTGCKGSKYERMGCTIIDKSVDEETLKIKIANTFTPSSITYACKINHDMSTNCKSNCVAKRESANFSECAILYREVECQDCYNRPIALAEGTIFKNNYSDHINSILVRGDCSLSEYVPGFRNLCNYKDAPVTYNYTADGDIKGKFTARAAYQSDAPELFTCSCGFNIVSSSPPFMSPTTVSLLPTETFSSNTEVPTTTMFSSSMNSSTSIDGFSSTNSSLTSDGNHDENLTYEISLGVISTCLVFALCGTVYLVISRRRLTLVLKRKDNFVKSTELDYKNTELTECATELPFDTTVNNFSINSTFEICSEHFQSGDKALGGGHFGEVHLGSLQVAVKTMRKDKKDEILSMQSLQHEVKILSYLGSHENVIRFLGASVSPSKNGEIFLITEYCKNGSLKDYLTHRVKPHIDSIVRLLMFKDLKLADDGYPETSYACNIEDKLKRFNENMTHDLGDLDPATLTRLLQWSAEIANGMEYITQKKVVHVDLAARNVLLTHNLTAKIGDFGLAKKVYVKEYVNSKKDYFPIMWVAPESLMKSKYSSKSDIWAYGVTVWEVFSLGRDPYEEMSSMEEILGAIIQGKGLGRAKFASESIHSTLTLCWREKPEDRPSFQELTEWFSSAKSQFELKQEQGSSSLLLDENSNM